MFLFGFVKIYAFWTPNTRTDCYTLPRFGTLNEAKYISIQKAAFKTQILAGGDRGIG